MKTAAAIRKTREKAEQAARQRLKERLAAGSVTDALAEFERLCAEVLVFKDICRERLEALGDNVRYEGKAGEQLRAEVAVYERGLDRCESVLSQAIRLGLAKRRQEVDEAQAAILVGVIKSVLGRLDLTRDQQQLASRVVPEELRAIRPNSAAPAGADDVHVVTDAARSLKFRR